MIKVCHMTSGHPPEDGRIFRKECVSLAQAGYDVYLVQRGASYEKDGVHIVGAGDFHGGRLSRMISYARNVYQTALGVDADIYHFHEPELLPYGLKLKRRGKIVIFDSHERYAELIGQKYYLPKWSRVLVARCYGAFERYVLRRIDGVVFPALKDGKDPFAGQCRHTAIVNNTALLSETYDQYDPDVKKDSESICYVGALDYGRGITHLVRAAARAQCELYLAGKFCPDSYRQELLSMPEAHCVHDCGILDRPAVMERIQRSQIGMATILNVGQYNQYDNLATKCYEYMSLGIPVILTRSPYNQKVVDQYRFGICADPENCEELAGAIRYLLDHPDEAQEMGENGRRAVREVFNWSIEEKKLLALYEEILNDKKEIAP